MANIVLMAMCVILDAITGGVYLAMAIFVLEDEDRVRGITVATGIIWIVASVLCMTSLFRIANLV